MDSPSSDHRLALSPTSSGLGRTAARSVLDKYIVAGGGCWEYTGARDKDGYGKAKVRLADGRPSTTNAHRVFYEALVGAIPAGLHLDHLCRNPPCVNPAHVEPVTLRVNTLRGWAASHPSCPQGHLFTPENTLMTTGRSGYRIRRCRTCMRARDAAAKRKWRREHPDRLRARNRAYYLANREQLVAAEAERRRRRAEK